MDVKEIETAIAQLLPAKVAELAEWLEQFHAQLWDNRFKQDLKVGRLDSSLEKPKRILNLAAVSRCEASSICIQ